MIPVRYTNEDFPVAPYGSFRGQIFLVKHNEDGRQEKVVCFRVSVSYTHLDVYKRQELCNENVSLINKV